MPEPVRIVISKPIAPIIAPPSKLGLAFDSFNFARVGMKAEIMPLDVDRFSRGDRFDAATAVPIGRVNPAIESVFEPIHPMLLIALSKAAEQNLFDVRGSVPIAVLRINNVRRGAD